MQYRIFALALVASSLGLAAAAGAQVLKIEGGFDDLLGTDVDMDGDLLLVGAPDLNDVDQVSGYAELYSVPDGQLLAHMWPGHGYKGSRFGSALAIEGDRALIGARLSDAHGQESGSVFLFSVPGGALLRVLHPSGAAAFDHFGGDIGLDGGVAVVGASGAVRGGHASGAAFLFSMQTATETQQLLPNDPADARTFGSAVAIWEDLVLVGDPNHAGTFQSGGAAYRFSVDGAQLARLVPDDLGQGNKFGGHAALGDGLALIGCAQDDDHGENTGSAYLYSVPDGQLIAKLTPDDPAPWDLFGYDVALHGTYALVGAQGVDDAAPNGGGLYVFSTVDGRQLAKLTASDVYRDSFLGTALAMERDFLAAGASGDQGQWGAVYVWRNGDFPGGTSRICDEGPCPCGNPGGPGEGCANSTGGGASLTVASGYPTVIADDLVLIAKGLPGSVTSLTFLGDQTIDLPFGDGRRCAGGALYRLPVQASSTAGELLVGPGIVAYTCSSLPPGGCINPGDTRLFQTWYRDPGGPCGSAFNVTNALLATFAPWSGGRSAGRSRHFSRARHVSRGNGVLSRHPTWIVHVSRWSARRRADAAAIGTRARG